MQIVIDIPEELYKANHRGLEAEELWDLRIAIKNGTPLPKGHGRLIDADALIYKQTHHGNYYTPFELIDRNGLNNAPTIIEADKAESEVPT